MLRRIYDDHAPHERERHAGRDARSLDKHMDHCARLATQGAERFVGRESKRGLSFDGHDAIASGQTGQFGRRAR